MSEIIAERPKKEWYRIHEPPHGVPTAKQEAWIRGWVEALGWETLRGFHMRMKAWDWDYYDILAMSP